MKKFICPKCGSKHFIRDQKSIRCNNRNCMYHLDREEKVLYLKSKQKHKRKLSEFEKIKKQKEGRIKSYYVSVGIRKGSLTLKQAAKLKGTTTSILYKYLAKLNVTRKPLRILYDSKLIKLKLSRRKKCLRQK